MSLFKSIVVIIQIYALAIILGSILSPESTCGLIAPCALHFNSYVLGGSVMIKAVSEEKEKK